MKKEKTGIVVAILIVILLIVLSISAFAVYKIVTNENDSSEYRISKENKTTSTDDIKSLMDSKIYRVISAETISKEDMEDIIYSLQKRAEQYTTEAVVVMKKRNSDWFVEISLPGMEDDVYEEIIKNPKLEFIAGYDTDDAEVIVTGKNIKSATFSTYTDSLGAKNYAVTILFDDEGTLAFAEGTRKYVGRVISIVLDGNVISAPYVATVITDGNIQVTGSSVEEAYSLATLLRVGSFDFELSEIKDK